MQTTIIDGVDELGAKVVAVNRDGGLTPPQLQQGIFQPLMSSGTGRGVRLVQL